MPKRVLLRGGHVLTMDPELGDLHGGDLLIEDDRIAAVGHGLEAADAEAIDVTDCIVIPGFVDSHRHTWETVIRGIAPDVSLDGYFDIVLDQLAPAYRPEDVYAGNYLGSLEAIDAGVTTLLDWSHISNSPEHADEAIRGLAPVIDPVSTVVHQADTRNVDTVLVAGRAVKQDGKLVGADLRAARGRAASSLEHLLQHTSIQPHWAQSAGTPAHAH